jgi:phosphatidyl-myo-inositol alpha-mannosyltransferase
MRIAMIGRALPRADYAGGVSGQMDLLAEALAHRGHQVTVHALNPPPAPAGYDYRPIPVPDSLRRLSRTALYLAPWWVSRIPLDDFDVVHAHGDDHFLRTRRPVVRTFYGAARAEARYSASLRHRLYHLSMVPLERISERRASAVVAISRSTQDYLTRRALIIPCGYDPTVFYPAGVKSVHPSVLFVGELGTRKRGSLLLAAFADVVRPAVPAAELWMVTREPLTAPGIRWFGRVPTHALADLYRQAWVFCLPSRYEGFGVPYLEAMACGTPAVATANGGAEEVLEYGRSGLIVRDHGLGEALVSLLTSEDTREAMAKRCVEQAKGYVIAGVARSYEALYRRVVRDASAPNGVGHRTWSGE